MNWKEDFLITKFKGEEYKINRRLFQAFVILVALVGFGIFFYYGADRSYHLYVTCENTLTGSCENPVYMNSKYCGKYIDSDSVLCTSKTLPDGFVYGSPPPKILGDFCFFTIIGLLLVIALNHYLYNRKVKMAELIDDDEEEKEEVRVE